MIILAIETSCDDTCISIVKFKVQNSKLKTTAQSSKSKEFEILANIVSSQVEIHRKYGGVYPLLAKREHQKNLVPILKKALREAKMLIEAQNSKFKVQSHGPKLKTLKKILERESKLLINFTKFLKEYKGPKIDAIAVTVGPGLEPCLWVGVNFAKALSYIWQKPIIPVNHIEAHILANWLTPIGSSSKLKTQNFKKIELPAICLVVSGGHTQLILMNPVRGSNGKQKIQHKQTSNRVKDFGKYKILGETRDDAAGECLDKIARILGLGYPGGPAIAAEAAKLKVKGNASLKLKIKLPRPMIYSKDYDFSFSGLKTAVLYLTKKLGPKSLKNCGLKASLCAEVQQAIIDVLIKKTIKAAKDYGAKTIMLGGGVTANEELRKQFKETVKKNYPRAAIYYPQTKFCTDNGAMVAVAGYYHYQKGGLKNWQDIKANANLKISCEI